MSDAKWAEEALSFAAEYAAQLAAGESAAPYPFFTHEQDAAYALFRHHFPELHVARLPQLGAAQRYVADRSWSIVISRLERKVEAARLLTLLRRDVVGSPDLCLVPRAQWACIELARHREGCYRKAASVTPTENETVRIEEKDGERCVVATRPLAPGEIVLRERVPAAVSYDDDPEVCWHCAKPLDSVLDFIKRPMPSCCRRPFCGETCRSAHSVVHAAECLRECQHDFKRRLAQRALQRGILAGLKTHADSLRANADARDELQEAECAVRINAIALGQTGCGIAPTAAMFNHSCLENATHYAVWDAGGEPWLVFRAVAPILAGEEVTICYLGEAMLADERRNEFLRQHKCFECRCARCLSNNVGCLPPLASRETSLDALATARAELEAALGLHPGRSSVAVGVKSEALADMLLQVAHAQHEAVELYERAAEHFATCRGTFDTPHFRRVVEKAARLTADTYDSHAPLRRTVVFEIKTWEVRTSAYLLTQLAPRVVHAAESDATDWEPAATLPLAYGVLALIVACRLPDQDAVELELAEALQTALYDDVQSVDVRVVSAAT